MGELDKVRYDNHTLKEQVNKYEKGSTLQNPSVREFVNSLKQELNQEREQRLSYELQIA